MSYYNTVQRQAIEQDTRQMTRSGIPLAGELEDIREQIATGPTGITAAGVDLNAVAPALRMFAQDVGTTSGLTFAVLAGAYWDGQAVVSVNASAVALSPSSTNYVYVDPADATVKKTVTSIPAGAIPLYTVVTGATSITSVTNIRVLLVSAKAGAITAVAVADVLRTRSLEIPIGTLTATGAALLILPAAGMITKVSVVVSTTVTTSDTTYWTLGLVNKGQAGAGVATVVNAATAGNSTKVTGGSALTGYVARDLTLDVVASVTGDVLAFAAVKVGAAADLVGLVLRVDLKVS